MIKFPFPVVQYIHSSHFLIQFKMESSNNNVKNSNGATTKKHYHHHHKRIPNVNTSAKKILSSTTEKAADLSLIPLEPMTLTQQKLHQFLQTFFAESTKRVKGKNGLITSFSLKYDNNETKTYYVVNLYHQMCIGAVGGITCGIETNQFSQPSPFFAALGQKKLNKSPILLNGVKNGSILCSIGIRAITAGLLFDVLDKNIEQYRDKKDWKNFASAGVISGAVFGLKGGLRASSTAAVGFGIFGGMAGFLDNYFK